MNSKLNDCLFALHLSRTYRYLISKLNNSLSEAGFDLTIEQFDMLFRIRKKQGSMQKYLSLLSGRDKTGVTRIITNLEKKGLVIRIIDNDDHRRKKIHLTSMGLLTLQSAFPIIDKCLSHSFDQISSSTLMNTRYVLGKIYRNLNTDIYPSNSSYNATSKAKKE